MKIETTYVLMAHFLGANSKKLTKRQREDSRRKARWLAKELAREGLKVVRK